MMSKKLYISGVNLKELLNYSECPSPWNCLICCLVFNTVRPVNWSGSTRVHFTISTDIRTSINVSHTDEHMQHHLSLSLSSIELHVWRRKRVAVDCFTGTNTQEKRKAATDSAGLLCENGTDLSFWELGESTYWGQSEDICARVKRSR